MDLKIKQGYSHISQSSVFVYGLARNISKELTNILPQVSKLVSYFKNSSILIYENDSTDDTVNVLMKWVDTNPLNHIVISETLHTKRMNDLSLQRVELMSLYRNKCLEKIDSVNEYYDYVIAIDLDLYGFSLNGLVSSFGWMYENDRIGGIGSNGRKNYSIFSPLFDIYYDAYAHKCKRTLDHNFRHIQKVYRNFSIGDDIIPVDSCFNGLMVYRSNAIKGLRYKAIPKYAEHVSFNQDVKALNNYDIYLNPNQLTYYDKISFNKYRKFIE